MKDLPQETQKNERTQFVLEAQLKIDNILNLDFSANKLIQLALSLIANFSSSERFNDWCEHAKSIQLEEEATDFVSELHAYIYEVEQAIKGF